MDCSWYGREPRRDCKPKLANRLAKGIFPAMNQDERNRISSPGIPAGLQALVERAGAAGKGVPPVDRWNPPFCGDIDMEIRRDGTWFYLGTPIGRMPLVKLFSSVLRKDEDGKTYLVTPVEKVGIRVVDAPFLAVEMDARSHDGVQVLTFRTQTGDIVEAGAANPIRFVTVEGNDGVKPYVLVRGRLEALLARPVMYELVALGEEHQVEGRTMFGVRSNGAFFPIMPADELARSSIGV
jgi:uncharacterized protein